MAELTTFGAMSSMEEPAPPPVQTPASVPAPSPALDSISTAIPEPVNNVVAAPEPVTAPIAEPEPNTASFDLSLGDESSTAPEPTPAPASYNWKDEIKKVDRKELLKEAALSDFALEMDEYIKSGGQAMDYLQARAIDYNKIPDEDLIKDNIRKKYPSFTPEDVEALFVEKYTSDILLRADAAELRQNKISEQQRFKVPETPIPKTDEAYEQWKQNKEQQVQQIEAMRDYYNSHPATKSLNESKRVTLNLGEGVAPFNFQIDKPEMLTRVFTDDGSAWKKLTSTTQGEPDVAKQQMIALFTYNPQKFIQDVFKYGQSHGLKEIVEEGQNAQRPQAKVATMTNTEGQTITVGKFGDRARN